MNTKYDLNNTVYALVDGKARPGVVVKRTLTEGISKDGDRYESTHYIIRFSKPTQDSDRQFFLGLNENQLYTTREELINSIE